ncbi:alpha/beta hydrolase family protein [Streptomyces yangpuensis]|uniref:Alpha/beta hydrolase family protein n=1 Tax=Streptomyces yangpuensis TaxID=1648182 RepID=A0ABY5PXW7_9ACTN|nr:MULTISPECIES: alpha/beta hydrolase [Streptomyces]UUY48944.1 alpha/beta hydrolase family protein [Streptomyces yangpuensis]
MATGTAARTAGTAGTAGTARTAAGAGSEGAGAGAAGAGEVGSGAAAFGSRRAGARGGRLRRTLLASLIAAAVVVPVSAAASAQAPAPAPAVFTEDASLRSRYAAHRANLAEAVRMAEDADRVGRADRLRAMAAAGTAQFLTFDGRGRGRAVEVFGDLETAERVAVLVPGSDTTLDTYERFRSGAVALQQRLQAERPRSAVVAWLGYDTPGTVSTTVLTAGRADDAAAELAPFLDRLAGMAAPGARLSLLCHSYGSVVCARTATGPAVGDMVLFGSPGTGAASARELPTTARVWSGRGGADWIAGVPHVRLGGLGFGTDPVDPAFGARAFNAGSGGHSDYLKPGTRSLDTLAAIVLGTAPVEEAGHA